MPFDDYCDLRYMPARTYVPMAVRPFWIDRVKHALDEVVHAASDSLRDDAMLNLLTLMASTPSWGKGAVAFTLSVYYILRKYLDLEGAWNP